METRYLTEKELCAFMSCSRSFARKLGELSGCTVKLGRAVRYDRAVLDAYLADKYVCTGTAKRE